MKGIELENAVTFSELKWDTDFFGVTSARAILHSSLTLNEWDKLKIKFKDFQFITIVNQNSEPINAWIIGKDTSSFLADINIQFVKKLFGPYKFPKNVTIHKSLKENDQVIKMADFQFSKFIEDPELAKRGGDQVYRQWVINSFNRPDKLYVLSRNENDEINGFLLYSYSDNTCLIELIAVFQDHENTGIGTTLFKAVEYEAYKHDCTEINVGTQVRNTKAINFYNKVGCKQVGCHQVYHLWNF